VNMPMTLPRGRLIAWAILLPLALAACSSAAPISPAATPEPALTEAGSTNHTPVILRVEDREENQNGILLLHKDIFFSDAKGDATVVANKIVGTDPQGGIFAHATDDPIIASPEEQKQEGLVTSTFGCPSTLLDPFSITIEDRVRDQAGNLSAPVTFTFSCAANPPSNLPFLIAGAIVGLVLLVCAWLFFRSHPSERGPTTLAILMLFCLLLPVSFMLLILHEGGHALSGLNHNPANVALFVHPFALSGYSRPMFEWSSVWNHAAGAVTAILGSLLISALFWKRRSVSNFPLVALFPLAAMGNGLGILIVAGDFRNIRDVTGLPPTVFNAIGFVIAAVGILSFLSLLPLLGLNPKDKKALLVLPGGYFLWGLLSAAAAYLFVPSSPFVVQYHLAGEILQSANSFLWVSIMGLMLAVIYLTLYRWLAPRLPGILQTEQVALTRYDLRNPGLLAALSVAAGMIVIL
jgi:hypothetical protein